MIKMDFRVRTVEDDFDLRKLKKFMRKQPQHYPDYREWVDFTCIPGIVRGERKAIVVLSDEIVVGDAVWKYLNKNNIEIKNFRIDAQYQRRDLGNFLMTQVARENPGMDLRLDVGVSNFQGVTFFILNGFKIIGCEELYARGQMEYLMRKSA